MRRAVAAIVAVWRTSPIGELVRPAVCGCPVCAAHRADTDGPAR